MPDVSVGFADGPGGYYKESDRSGPYAIDSQGDVSLISGQSKALVQMGYQQITGLTSATSLSVPPGASQATIVAEGASVRYRSDGTDPTPLVGMPLAAGSQVVLNKSELSSRFIGQAPGAVLNVQYQG